MAEVDLPEEVLLHILSFIPHQEMDNVMLVNKTFYAYCSKQKSFKQRLCINKDKLSSRSTVVSMKYSLRRFEKLTIVIDDYDEWYLNRLQAILDNLGEKVTTLYINAVGKSETEVEQSAVIGWLNAMPNLETISSGGLYSCKETSDDNTTELNLRKLHTVYLCPLALGLKLHLMPQSSLKYLQLNDKIPLPNINEVFKRHSETLNSVILFRTVYEDPLPFRHLKLTKFVNLYQEYMNNRKHNDFLSDIIGHQPGLKILDLGEGDMCSNCYPVNSELLSLICNQTQLEKLSIGINHDVTPLDISDMRKLKNLNELLIQTSFEEFEVTHDVFEAFASTKIPNLKILRLETNVNFLTVNAMHTLGQSFPQLEEYSGDYNDEDRETELETFNVFLESFPNLTGLELTMSHYEFIAGGTYPNMRKLILWCADGEIDLTPALIQSMPNLEEIQVESMKPRYATFKAILRSRAITKVDITISSVDDLSYKSLRKLNNLADKIMEKGDECSVVFPDELDEEFLDSFVY